MEKEVKINLPIYPKDIFRLLALRSITETSGLFEQILKAFNDISRGIRTTPRLYRRNPFSYRHPGLEIKKDYSKMTERQLCAAKSAFYDQEIKQLGRIIDYELPLDDKKDSALGKVDLVAVAPNDEVILLEVKKCKSNEHPLRAMFEAFTFWRTLTTQEGEFKQFLKCYKRSHPFLKNFDDAKVLPGLLLCDSSEIFKSLISCFNDGSAKNELYRRFMSDEIGMKIYSYKRENLNVEDKTKMMRSRLGIS